ncbi:hypothetical protein ACIHDR_40835 [Nocardia sp. NPDC052278]|uniref:hypothetical protein n=1 Tax=unclassified Nocardia TaxID=2637762 RepID=UPI0036C45A1E
MADSPRTRPGTIILGRLLAIGSIASSGLHLAGVGAHGLLHGLVVLTMTLACLRCVPALWIRPCTDAFGLAALLNLVMVAVHFSMSTAGGHVHHGANAPANGSLDPLQAVTLGAAVFEALFATSVVFAMARGVVIRESNRIGCTD